MSHCLPVQLVFIYLTYLQVYLGHLMTVPAKDQVVEGFYSRLQTEPDHMGDLLIQLLF
jgi:hypothetical protein